MDLQAEFAKYEDEWIKFSDVKDKRHSRPDLCAFLILADLVPSSYKDYDIVTAAEHDQIWLDVDCEKLAKVVTPEIVHDLAGCGVFYDDDIESLTMFV